MEQFVACFEGPDDPLTGNAALHDFHELLLIALCTSPSAADTLAAAALGLFCKLPGAAGHVAGGTVRWSDIRDHLGE